MTPEQRLAAFQKIVEQKPGDPFARYSLAMALRGAGRTDDAVEQFRALVERAPDYVPTYLMLGQALETLGRDAEAAAVYTDGIAAAARKQDGHAQGELTGALEAVRARGASR